MASEDPALWTEFGLGLVGGLVAATFYHWRVRTVSSNPFFPRSPWMSLAGNNVTQTKLRTGGCIDGDGDGYETGDPSCVGPLLISTACGRVLRNC